MLFEYDYFKKIFIPEQYTKVRLSLEEFHRLADKLDFVPVLENDDTLIFLEPEGEIAYFAKKVEETRPQTDEISDK